MWIERFTIVLCIINETLLHDGVAGFVVLFVVVVSSLQTYYKQEKECVLACFLTKARHLSTEQTRMYDRIQNPEDFGSYDLLRVYYTTGAPGNDEKSWHS